MGPARDDRADADNSRAGEARSELGRDVFLESPGPRRSPRAAAARHAGPTREARQPAVSGDSRQAQDAAAGEESAWIIAALNTGTSSGFRDVIRFPSLTTGLST